MRNGLLAEWRRGIVARGLAAAALLSVPVAVAAAIGFGTSVADLGEGLESLASGPDRSQATPQDTDSEAINSAIEAIATTPGANGPARGGGGVNGGGVPEDGGTGGGGGGAPPGGAPVAGGGQPGGAGDPAGGGGEVTDVTIPSGGGGVEDTVNDVLNGVSDTVSGLLGG